MIRVQVEDETGRVVTQGIDVPAGLIARPDDLRFSCLRFVDPFGDTLFNRVQLPALLDDLRTLRGSCDVARHEPLLREVEALIERCRAEPHLYLRLVGD